MKELEVICFGEILWDNLKKGRRLGGAPLNVCYHLSKMGIETRIISQIGKDEDGKAILENLHQLGIGTEYIMLSDSWPTSTVEVNLGEANQVQYEIVEDVAWDYITYSSRLGELVTHSKVLVFGSLVARNKVSCQTLFKFVEKSKYRIFDVNLRTPFFDRTLILSLLAVTHLLKLNQEELVEISSWLGTGSGDKKDMIRGIQENYPNIEEILLTRGHKGAVYIRGEEWVKVPAYEVEVKDTVGSGDSFLAAFIAAKLRGLSVEASLEKASLLSGFVATRNGACPVYDAEDLKKFKEDRQLPK